ncbi:type VI secretion system baseplate subunit TssK [Jannaschia seohaensis]|uniref:Type VI secretion system protein ImpJ n=1 Tax=Jannaschia seohaensis TaxID=475081 RepID=A0A2Y9AWZ4_9RHOB|nr:type VI secretion system baseplate subunit TssK [Jannaschia seohaensis]PWJ16554.1 type VI secretion system protein ImpJ [Jannaschia seohaensis]SSA48791.1 type VI secretion system protein ImpJ [Jannaschia seohaensis]
MTSAGKVVWSEGLFLRTQHLQQQDRHVDWLVRQLLAAQPLQGFGFRRLELDQAALDAGQVGLSAAVGVLPDGTVFDAPDGVEPIEPVPVTGDTAAGLVHLALPAHAEGGVEIDAAHDAPGGARLRGYYATTRDAIRGGAEPNEIEVARPAPKLLLPGDETAGYTTLPIARIEGLTTEGAVGIDRSFLAPALRIGAVPWYATLLRELVTGIDRIADAHGSMVRGGTGASMENLLILEIANSALPRLAHLLAQDDVHPSELFLELAGIAGRMATYGASDRRMRDLPVYDHISPGEAFGALADTLRSLVLSLQHVAPKSRALQVSRHSDNIWTVRIDNPEIIHSSRIVLRVGGDLSEALLRKIFVDQATVGAAGSFDKLWTARLTGIPLKPLNSQPREIPYDGDRLCLELDRSSEHWAALADAPGFVLGVAGDLPRQPEVDCYAVSR